MLYQKLHESQEKYTYYVLGITALSIGFIIANLGIVYIQIKFLPLVLSVILLSISFLSGLKNIEYRNSIIYANLALLQVSFSDIEMENAAKAGIREAIDSNMKKNQNYSRCQSIFMLTGMVSYFIFILLSKINLVPCS